MIQQLDHLVILVDDLQTAMRDYETLGFNVVPGGEHSDGATHNALVAFADGSYLELIAFRREAPEHRWWRHTAHGEGLIDWALLPSDTAEDVAAAKRRGLTLDGPTDGGRLRPDGVELRWQTALPPSPDLPFLCGDVTPRTLRVPSGAAHVHPNGAQGIAQVIVAVSNLDTSMDRYAALLGFPALKHNDELALWKLGDTRIWLAVQSADVSGAMKDQIRDYGDGPFALHVRTSGGSQHDPSTALTHGVFLRLDPGASNPSA